MPAGQAALGLFMSQEQPVLAAVREQQAEMDRGSEATCLHF